MAHLIQRHFGKLPDPRRAQGRRPGPRRVLGRRHSLAGMMVTAVICAADS